ncbi:MAG: GntR family transcriptional regulator [Bacillota bacterium]
MFIDKKSPIPAYFQLKEIIVEKIRKGEYQQGKSIPSERELSVIFGLSRMTVRQALNQLAHEGILSREKGRGTFVSRLILEQRNLMSFTELARSKGMSPGTRILQKSMVRADKEMTELLDLKSGDTVYRIKRLRLVDGVPVGIEEAFIPTKYCRELEKYDISASLYRIFWEKYGYYITHGDNIIGVVKASPRDKKTLDIAGEVPLLSITSIKYTAAGLKLYYEKSLYRSDLYEYQIRVFSDVVNIAENGKFNAGEVEDD